MTTIRQSQGSPNGNGEGITGARLHARAVRATRYYRPVPADGRDSDEVIQGRISPTGLSLQWGYTSPDGAQVFYGEAALMKHVLKTGLLDTNEILTSQSAPTPQAAANTTSTSAAARTRGASAAAKRTSTDASAERTSTGTDARTASSTTTTARTTRPEAASKCSMAHNRAQQSDSTDIRIGVVRIDTSV
ncbi:unnamed protein product [Phytophthora fragariaefolia]|uniref:Unnamed protein product n=1 Tax=Phytophthora fragariaefolia TaxID=1490495 RepID=A0A9W6TUT7_9STRA|nr:unnamed protein product [Phytophthora fragariaefolia]